MLGALQDCTHLCLGGKHISRDWKSMKESLSLSSESLS